MKVSVIIPVYNGERFISEAIRSVLMQTLDSQEYEVVVVDDGSTDGSAEKIQEYRGRIVYVSQRNAGVSAARNAGVNIARGEYIAFLDQDDLFRADKLEKMTLYLDTHPEHGMVYSYLARIDHTGKFMSPKRSRHYVGDIFPRLFMKNYLYPSIIMCRKQVILDAGLFQERFSSRGDDSDLFLRISLKTKVGVIREHLSIYRCHEENISKTVNDTMPFATEEILSQYKHHLLQQYPLGWWIYRCKMSRIYREQAMVFFSQAEEAKAKHCLRTSLRFFPFRIDTIWRFLMTTNKRGSQYTDPDGRCEPVRMNGETSVPSVRKLES